MQISRSAATAKGPAATFTGDVWVDPITRGLPTSQLNVAAVRFSPGARSAWHSHEGRQTLYVTEGRGLVQARGHQITELNPGDVVFAPDGEEHLRAPGTSGPKGSAIGLGCMGLSYHRSGVLDGSEAIALIRGTVDLGLTLFDTAQVYGPFTNEHLVGDALGASVHSRSVRPSSSCCGERCGRTRPTSLAAPWTCSPGTPGPCARRRHRRLARQPAQHRAVSPPAPRRARHLSRVGSPDPRLHGPNAGPGRHRSRRNHPQAGTITAPAMA